MKKKLISALTALVMVLCLAPATVSAAGVQSGPASLTVNSSKVAFAGHEWWVIGDASSGVYPQAGHITLLSANADFGSTEFRSLQTNQSDGYTKYNYYYYANNPKGMAAWQTPIEYAGSTLQQKMESITNTIKTNSCKESAFISARNLTSTDGIKGQSIDNQKLWILSYDEASAVKDRGILSYDETWTLRSPSRYTSISNVTSAFVTFDGGVCINRDYYHRKDGNDGSQDEVRPALSLNTSSVLFTSSASASGKSSATAGGSLVSTAEPTGTVKFTMKDSTQTLKLCVTKEQSTQTGDTLSFNYSNATTGKNQYVSCVLTDSNGAAVYYGKLKGCTEKDAASGTVSVPLTGVADGTYTLKIFSEEANGDTYTDFCSEPVTMTVTVSDNKGTVSDFGGTIHTGGTATCKSGAICTICEEPYSEKNPQNHANLKHFAAKAATAESEGNIEYWYCDGCGKYYKDAEATKEIKKADTVIAKLASDSQAKAKDKTKDSSAETGDDSNMYLWITLLLASGCAAAAVTVRRRRHSS